MNETTNTNNPELINKIHKEYMYYNTDGFSGKYKKEIFKAGFESAVTLINHVNNNLLEDVIKHLGEGDTATSSVKKMI